MSHRVQALKYYSKKYAPEILTIVGLGGHVTSNILFIRAEKLYLDDNKKSHFILPCVVSLGSMAAIIASNRVSNTQKVSLLAASSAVCAKYVNDRKAIKGTVEEEALTSNDLEALMKKADEANEVPFDEYDGCVELFYLPDYGIMFWADPAVVMKAELNLNEHFVHDGYAYLSDFFRYAEIQDDEEKTLDSIGSAYGWRFNWDDYDSGLQYIAFDNYEKLIKYKDRDVVCHYIYFQEEALPMHEWDRIYGDNEE